MLLQRIRKSVGRNGFRGFLRNLDRKAGIGRLEYLLATNWLNPFATLWLNFRSLPLPQAFLLPIWVYGRPRFYSLSGSIRIRGAVRPGMIQFNPVRSGSPSVQSLQSELQNDGTIIFEGKGIIGTGTRIFVNTSAVLTIGDDFKIADMVNIGCMRSISIGKLARIPHRCQIFDSNYHYLANFNKRAVPDRTYPIKIGQGCWLGNSSTVSGGASIPDFTIVCSNSLVNKSINDIPTHSLIGGIPAKLLTTGIKRVYSPELNNRISEFYHQHPGETYMMPDDMTMDDCI